jgi:hypothetical protein
VDTETTKDHPRSWAEGKIGLVDHGHLQPAKCYLHAKGIDRLDPFTPVLKDVAERGPFLFVAIVLLNLRAFGSGVHGHWKQTHHQNQSEGRNT